MRIKHDVAVPPKRLLLLREGDIGWDGLAGFNLDAESARKIIRSFTERGNKILIDWEHADEDVRKKRRDRAPAAGWINGLEYVDGEGLYAVVGEWTAEAASAIRAHEYKYISPVIDTNEKKEILDIVSVAMTNQPRTKHAPELATMTKTKTVRRIAASNDTDSLTLCLSAGQGVRDFAPLLRRAGAEGADDFPEVSADVEAINSLMAALKAKGVELADDASLADIIAEAVKILSVGAASEESAAAKVAAHLGFSSKDLKAITGEVAALKIKASGYEGIAKELDAIRKERTAARVETLVETAIEEGKLNPNDEAQIKAARQLAESDEETFKHLVGGLIGIEPGSIVRKEGTNVSRESVIADAARTWRDDPQARCSASQKYYVDSFLIGSDMPRLKSDEIGKLLEIN